MSEDALRWDQRHEGRETASPSCPNGLDPLLLPAGGLCLDVACGRGAQSVWAALNGLDVIALDVSGVAVAATLELAAEHGVGSSVECRVHDVQLGLPGDVTGKCDLVVCQRFRDEDLYPMLVNAARPGGIVVISVLSVVDSKRPPGRFHASAGELELAFQELDVDIISHTEVDGIATLIARRSEPS